MTIDFAEAVERARKSIESQIRDLPWDREMAMKGLRMTHDSMTLSRNPTGLITRAANSREDFDLAKRCIADHLELGNQLPPEAQAWLVQYLRGTVRRPNDKAGPKGHPLSNEIFRAVENLVSEGMNATRNREAKRKESACDAVAQALAELGLKQSATYDGVKRVWSKMKSEFREAAKQAGRISYPESI